MNDPLTLPQPQTGSPEPLQLETTGGPPAPPLSDEVIKSRTAKATMGLADLTGHWSGDFYNFIASGREQDMRKEASARMDAQNVLNRQQAIARAAAAKDPNKVNELLAPIPKSDPSSVVEDAYAQSYLHPLLNTSNGFVNESGEAADAASAYPNAVNQLRRIGAGIASRREYFQTAMENAQAEVDQQSWPGYLADQAKQVFQPYNEYKLRGNTDNVGFFRNLLGENLADQAEEINRNWPQSKDKFDATMERLKQTNPSMAVTFANYAMGTSTASRTLDDVFSIVGMTDALGVGKAAASKIGKFFGKTSTVWGVNNVTKQMVKSLENVGTPPKTLAEAVEGPIKQTPEVAGLAAVGDQEGSIIAKKARQLIDFVTGHAKADVNAIESLTDVMRVDRQDRDYNLGYYGREIGARINEAEDTYMNKLFKAFKDTLQVNRIADVVWSEEQFKKVAQSLKDLYFGPDNQIMNINGPFRETMSNTWHVGFVMGRDDATYFHSYREAASSPILKKFPLTARVVDVPTMSGGPLMQRIRVLKSKYSGRVVPGSEIKKDGYGYYINIKLPINEIDDVVRNALGHTAESTAPTDMMGGWIDATIGWIRNPDETQALDQTFARKIATNAPSNFLETVREGIVEMRKLSPASNIKSLFQRERWDRFERMLRYGQQAIDPVTKKQGMFFRNPGDLEEWYLRTFKQMPDQDTIASYFEFKRIVESDRWFRIRNLVRNKYRIGTMSHTVSVQAKDGSIIKANPFEGILSKDKVGGEGTTLIIKRQIDHSKLIAPDDLSSMQHLAEANENITSGKATHIRVYDPQSYPLKEFLEKAGLPPDARVQHVVTYNNEIRPLDWGRQLGRTGGGHLEQDHPFYLKWAKMAFDPISKKWWYHGDGTFGVGNNEKELQGYADHINAIHDFMDKGDEAGAKAYFQKSNLPGSWSDLKAHYKPSRNPLTGELLPPRLNPKEKIHVVPRDKMLVDVLGKDLERKYGDKLFRDGTRQGSPARQAQVQFTGERDVYELQHVLDKGSRYNPLYDLQTPELIDPITMMNRAMGTIINSMFMDDVKNTAVEHWLFGNSTGTGKGAAEWIDSSEDQIKRSPFFHFLQPKYTSAIPEDVRLRLEADRMKIQMFLGQASKLDAVLDASMYKLQNSIYEKFGAKGLRASESKWFVPLWYVPMIKNGPQFLRNVIYRAKMGFFSPRQFFIHAFTIMNGALISGWEAASRGTFAGIFLDSWARINEHPDVLNHMDGIMEKLGWRPGWFKEAREGALRTGYFHVERGRLALVDNPLSDNVLSNWRESFLDKGQAPFRAGVGKLKQASWYMAYHEWRKVNPTAKLTDQELSRVLERADQLSHNMTRASTSVVQKGFATFGAQFTSYNLRVLELLTGKRLTRMEKIRLFFGYGALLGVPTAGGIVGLSTYARQTAQNAGYVPGSDFLQTAIMEGMLPTVLYEGTGHLYNIGESYGAKDLDIVDSALAGDATWYQTFGGAAYSTLANVVESSNGFWKAMGSMYRGDGQFKLKADDFLSVLKEISSVNYATRAYVGINTGRWLSRNEAYLSDTTWENALASGLFGLTEQETADIYTKSLTVKEWQAQEAHNFKLYAKEMNRFFRAMADNDIDNALDYGKRAQVYLELMPADRRAQAMADVGRNNEPLISRADWNFYLGRSVPDNLRPDKLNTYQQIQNRNTNGK